MTKTIKNLKLNQPFKLENWTGPNKIGLNQKLLTLNGDGKQLPSNTN